MIHTVWITAKTKNGIPTILGRTYRFADLYDLYDLYDVAHVAAVGVV